MSDNRASTAIIARQLASLIAGEPTASLIAPTWRRCSITACPTSTGPGFYFTGAARCWGRFRASRPACASAWGNGVCGTAGLARRNRAKSARRPRLPRPIACDPVSQSELVVPLIEDGRVHRRPRSRQPAPRPFRRQRPRRLRASRRGVFGALEPLEEKPLQRRRRPRPAFLPGMKWPLSMPWPETSSRGRRQHLEQVGSRCPGRCACPQDQHRRRDLPRQIGAVVDEVDRGAGAVFVARSPGSSRGWRSSADIRHRPPARAPRVCRQAQHLLQEQLDLAAIIRSGRARAGSGRPVPAPGRRLLVRSSRSGRASARCRARRRR